jgi:hypothetical protein
MADGSGTLSYQWFRNGLEIEGATSSILERVNVVAADAGIYTVRISNAAGSKWTEPAILTVTTPAEAAHLTMVRSDLDPERLFLVITGTPGAQYRLEYSDELDGWAEEHTFIMPSSDTATWQVRTPQQGTRVFRVISVR